MTTPPLFVGSVPELYDRYLVPFLFAPYADDLAARLPQRAGLRVLELAAGTGAVTRRLRAALPDDATLVATDLSDAMLDHARTAVPLDGIEWRQADAQALPFEDESFDIVVCQFGFMFLPDKVQGFREARRVLRDRGELLANVWNSTEENPTAGLLQELLDERLSDDAPRFLDIPHGYSDPERLRADLAAAGFDDVALEVVRRTGEAPSGEHVARGLVTGSPLSMELIQRGVDLEELVADLTRRYAEVSGDDPFQAELVATVITAMR